MGERGIQCEKLPPDREAITEESVASVSESLLGREHVRTSSNIAMTVIAALINAEPAASRQPASRHPDVDVALPSSPASSERLQGGGEGEKSEEEEGRLELEITRRWKIGDAIKEEGILEIRWVGGKSKKPPLPSSFPLPSFLLTLHLRVLFAAE